MGTGVFCCMDIGARLSIESLDPADTIGFSHIIMGLALVIQNLHLLDVPGFSGDLGSD